MKKQTIFIILGILLVIVIGVIALFSSLNKEKISITANEFKTFMQDKGYSVLDETNLYSQYDYVKQVCIAEQTDNSYQIEFYELSDVEHANTIYNNNKSKLETSKGNVSGETSVSMKNYSKYSLTTDGKYNVISRIDNTLIFLEVDSNYKNVVKELLDELGY